MANFHQSTDSGWAFSFNMIQFPYDSHHGKGCLQTSEKCLGHASNLPIISTATSTDGTLSPPSGTGSVEQVIQLYQQVTGSCGNRA